MEEDTIREMIFNILKDNKMIEDDFDFEKFQKMIRSQKRIRDFVEDLLIWNDKETIKEFLFELFYNI